MLHDINNQLDFVFAKSYIWIDFIFYILLFYYYI